MTVLKPVIYLLVLLCAACNLNPQGSGDTSPTLAPLPTDVPPPLSEVTLNTYTNMAYGYSLQYPSNLTIEGDQNSQFVWLGDQIWVMVSEQNPEQPMGDAPVIENAQDTMIGANTARRLSGYVGSVGGNTPQRYESFVIQNDNRYYQFIAYELPRGEVQPVDRTVGAVPANVVALLEQIVASMRFTT